MSKESRRKARLRKWHERRKLRKHRKAELDYPFDEFARIFVPPGMQSYIYAEEDGY